MLLSACLCESLFVLLKWGASARRVISIGLGGKEQVGC